MITFLLGAAAVAILALLRAAAALVDDRNRWQTEAERWQAHAEDCETRLLLGGDDR